MSYCYTMTVKCDGCGYRLRDAIVKIRSDLETLRWKWNKEMSKEGVMFREQWRAPTRVFCQKCADGHVIPTTLKDSNDR